MGDEGADLMDPIQIAKICHEANRAYCEALGDYSQSMWVAAPDWQIQSAIAGVNQILRHPETTPEQSHQGWFDMKFRDGWKYGPVKDPEKKEHPCMLPYDRLPEDQRRKDALFGAIVRALM